MVNFKINRHFQHWVDEVLQRTRTNAICIPNLADLKCPINSEIYHSFQLSVRR